MFTKPKWLHVAYRFGFVMTVVNMPYVKPSMTAYGLNARFNSSNIGFQGF